MILLEVLGSEDEDDLGNAVVVDMIGGSSAVISSSSSISEL
jgi:hypothetical protein